MSDVTFKHMMAMIMEQAKQKGFGTSEDELVVAEKIALIHAEVSEAFDAYRHKDLTGKHGFEAELGDAVQRIIHLAGCMNIDLEQAILAKLEANKDRDWDWSQLNEAKDR